MTIETIDPCDVRLRHDVDADRFVSATESLREHGWVGRPVVVYEWEGVTVNLTGCHRISAAVEIGMSEIPAIVIRPQDQEELDRLEYAAANDDIEAGWVIGRFFDEAIGELVAQG